MVAQISAKFPNFRGPASLRDRIFGALAQTFGRYAIPFIKTYIVTSAKRIGADLFQIAAREIEEVASGRKKPQNICKRCWNKNSSNQLGGGKKKSKRRNRRTISRKNSSRIGSSRKDIFDKIKVGINREY